MRRPLNPHVRMNTCADMFIDLRKDMCHRQACAVFTFRKTTQSPSRITAGGSPSEKSSVARPARARILFSPRSPRAAGARRGACPGPAMTPRSDPSSPSAFAHPKHCFERSRGKKNHGRSRSSVTKQRSSATPGRASHHLINSPLTCVCVGIEKHGPATSRLRAEVLRLGESAAWVGQGRARPNGPVACRGGTAFRWNANIDQRAHLLHHERGDTSPA